METNLKQYKGYLLVASIGAFVGGAFVAVMTRAIPNIVTQVMTRMMGQMMSQMKAEGCSPADI